MNEQLVNAILPIVVAILFSFIAGGTTIAALFVLTLDKMLKSPVILSTLEKLYSGLSPEWQTVVKDTVSLGEEVTDGVPADQKGALATLKDGAVG